MAAGLEAEAGSEAEAAKQVIERFTTRAFRRPPTAQELTRLTGFYDKNRKDKSFAIDKKVLFLIKNLVIYKFYKKLSDRFVDLFEIISIVDKDSTY